MRCAVCGMRIPDDSRLFYAEGKRVCRGCHGSYVSEGMKEGFIAKRREWFAKTPKAQAAEISATIFAHHKSGDPGLVSGKESPAPSRKERESGIVTPGNRWPLKQGPPRR